MSLIYIITNIINGKQYIGQTIQKFDCRLSQHLSRSKKGCPYAFHGALRKYGIENFHIECLKIKGDINLWEKHLIKRWNTIAPNGYNLKDGGEKDYKLTKETKDKLSKARLGIEPWNKGMKFPDKMGANNSRAVSIILIDKNGIEEHFDCMADACRKYNLNHSHLSRVASGGRKLHKGYQCRYAEKE